MSDEEEAEDVPVRDSIRDARAQTKEALDDLRGVFTDIREHGVLSRRPVRDRLRKMIRRG